MLDMAQRKPDCIGRFTTVWPYPYYGYLRSGRCVLLLFDDMPS
jgi:hypothetical protein